MPFSHIYSILVPRGSEYSIENLSNVSIVKRTVFEEAIIYNLIVPITSSQLFIDTVTNIRSAVVECLGVYQGD